MKEKLDKFFEGESCKNICSTYQTKFLMQLNGTSEKVVCAIQKYEYDVVDSEMSTLKLFGDVGDYFLQSKTTLHTNLNEFMEEIRCPAIMLKNNREIDQIKSIVGSLNRIERAKKFVSQYFDTPDKLDEFLVDTKMIIEEKKGK